MAEGDLVEAQPVVVEGPAPVRELNVSALRNLGAKHKSIFDKYAAERLPAEQRWLKNLRQKLGIYDPEVERQIPPNRSKAYPRLTRVKCVSLLSRIMNLVFPGNEDNWSLSSSPSPEMDPEDVALAVSQLMSELQAEGEQVELTQDLVDLALRQLAEKNASQLTKIVKDQLAELGTYQMYDWIALNRKVLQSGIDFGLGVLEGPYVEKVQQSGWMLQADGGFQPVEREIYKPMYEWVSVWDFYPDMSAKVLPGEGHFTRKVMGRRELKKLIGRPDFFDVVIREVLSSIPGGNYQPKSWENDLKAMGNSIETQHAAHRASGREKFEVIVWRGPISAHTLAECGVDVPEDQMHEDVECEMWMVDHHVIKAQVNAWRKLGVEMPTVHCYVFDEDDTSPIGPGLPQIMRDSQLSLCAATRMMLDNAGITCGPNLEVNTTLLRSDQDVTSIEQYKVWMRDDEGVSAQFPAVRNVEIQSHLTELERLVQMFGEFAEMETFIGPQTGGDMQKGMSEAMRTIGGSSMMRGDAALPFKDIVRNFDTFTISVITSLVKFNKALNPDQTPKGDYNSVARGATSLIAKEMRGMQIDTLMATMTEDEKDHIDERKLVEQRFAVRDLEGMLVAPETAERRKSQRAKMAGDAQDQLYRRAEAEIKEILSSVFKNITQGQKNAAAADAQAVTAAVKVLETDNAIEQGPGDGAGQGDS